MCKSTLCNPNCSGYLTTLKLPCEIYSFIKSTIAILWYKSVKYTVNYSISFHSKFSVSTYVSIFLRRCFSILMYFYQITSRPHICYLRIKRNKKIKTLWKSLLFTPKILNVSVTEQLLIGNFIFIINKMKWYQSYSILLDCLWSELSRFFATSFEQMSRFCTNQSIYGHILSRRQICSFPI